MNCLRYPTKYFYLIKYEYDYTYISVKQKSYKLIPKLTYIVRKIQFYPGITKYKVSPFH